MPIFFFKNTNYFYEFQTSEKYTSNSSQILKNTNRPQIMVGPTLNLIPSLPSTLSSSHHPHRSLFLCHCIPIPIHPNATTNYTGERSQEA
jgi:hypothetical protein